MDASHMINRCFRHQHPEAYGSLEVSEPSIPAELRYGRDRLPDASQEYLVEEVVGRPDARPISD
ncbi:MAG TPA: hypothetical protein VFE48_22450 [Methylomirabilota bacterium]|nr:hypothetical protein [Methylomirabilota bacterium]